MSRYLSVALDAKEPHFRQGLIELERANMHPNTDIRLTSDIMQGLRIKLKELKLDPDDTTSEELYHALNTKLKDDDQKLLKKLRSEAANKVNAEANAADGLKTILEQLDMPKDCFVLKNSSVRSLLKTQPPKKVMKHLGYRSLESLLKREQLPLVMLAINKFESDKYIADFYNHYTKFKPTDFETRELVVLQPKSTKWQSILADIETGTGHTMIGCYELGSLILMPLDNILKPGLISANLVLILNELSKIISTSTYLKLHQVSPDFGQKLYQVAEHQPMTNMSLMGRPIPWHLVQSVLKDVKDELDMPHLSGEDFNFTKMIDKLGDIVDDFKFWQSTEFLGLVKKTETTSLNILDVARNLCDQLPFEKRQTDNFKDSLWSELLRRYIDPKTVAANLSSDFQPDFAQELAEA